MNINEYKIKLSGVANIEGKLSETEKFVDLTISNATLSGDIHHKDNKDGTHNAIYKIVITGESQVNILCENEIVKSKKKGSQSQLLRSVLHEWWTQQFCCDEPEFEPFYKKELSKLIKIYKDKLI